MEPQPFELTAATQAELVELVHLVDELHLEVVAIRVELRSVVEPLTDELAARRATLSAA